MKVSEIVIATGGKLISGDETMEITGFSQDMNKMSKSEGLRVKPMPNIMTPSSQGM